MARTDIHAPSALVPSYAGRKRAWRAVVKMGQSIIWTSTDTYQNRDAGRYQFAAADVARLAIRCAEMNASDFAARCRSDKLPSVVKQLDDFRAIIALHEVRS